MFGNGSCDEYDVSVSRVILKLCPNSLNVESWGKDVSPNRSSVN